MRIDVLFVAWNRYEFTRFAFTNLLANTNWDLVETLHVYDDGSTDGTRELLLDMIERERAGLHVEIRFHETQFGSPVAIMNDYIETAESDRFAKIDNDIVVPPGWLEVMNDAMTAYPAWEILGMEAGRTETPAPDFDGVYTVEPARWIGGVGLIRTRTLGERPRMVVNGRFGWTEWQREYTRRIAWIKPDLAVTELSRVPFEPWRTLSEAHRGVETEEFRPDLERDWPRYHEKWCEFYWAWWPKGYVVPDPDRDERIERWGVPDEPSSEHDRPE